MAAATPSLEEFKQYLDDREIYYLRHCFAESDKPDVFLKHYFHFRGFRPDVVDKLLDMGKVFKRNSPAPVLPQNEIILPTFQIPKFSIDKPIRPNTVQILPSTASLPPSFSLTLPKITLINQPPTPAPMSILPKSTVSEPITAPIVPAFPPSTSTSSDKSAMTTYDFITGLRSGEIFLPSHLCKRYSPSEYFVETKQLYSIYESWMNANNSKPETSNKFYTNFRRIGVNLILDRSQYTGARTTDSMGNKAPLF